MCHYNYGLDKFEKSILGFEIMKKYLLLIMMLAFVGMRAESGWEDFGTYKKQKEVLAKIDKFQLSADGKYYFTYQNTGIIKKWDVETGVLTDSTKLEITPQYFNFASDGTSALILNKYTNFDKPTELILFDLETMEISKYFSFIPNSGVLIPQGRYPYDFQFQLIDFIKNYNEILMSYS